MENNLHILFLKLHKHLPAPLLRSPPRFLPHHLRAFQHVAQGDRRDFLIRNFNADRRFSGNRRFDAHAGGGKIQRNIIHQIGNRPHPHALLRLQFIPGNGGASGHIHHFGANLEGPQSFYETVGVGPQFLGHISLLGRERRRQTYRRKGILLFRFLGLPLRQNAHQRRAPVGQFFLRGRRHRGSGSRFKKVFFLFRLFTFVNI